MSLLLDALQRASREKAGAAAVPSSTSNGPAPSVAAVHGSAGTAEVPPDTQSLSLLPAEWPALKPMDEEGQHSVKDDSSPEAVAPPPPAELQTLRLADHGHSGVEEPRTHIPHAVARDALVPGTLSHPQDPQSVPQLPLAVSDAAPDPSLSQSKLKSGFVSSTASSAASPPARGAGTIADESRSTQRAQSIQRAHAQSSQSGLGAKWARHRRAGVLVLLAMVLALSGGSLFLGLWGDPAEVLGLASQSRVAVSASDSSKVGRQPLPTSSALPPESGVSERVELPKPEAQPSGPLPVELPPAARLAEKSQVGGKKPGTSDSAVRPNVPNAGRDKLPAAESGSEREVTKPTAISTGKAEIAVRTRQPSLAERAYVALENGQLAEAREMYETAHKANAQDRDVLLGLAYISVRAGRSQDALAYYQDVLRFDPGNSSAQAGLMALEAQSSIEPSASRARDLAQRQPESASAVAAAAGTLVREGQLAEAAQMFERAHALAPSVAAYAFNHAVALDKLGYYAKAVPQYEVALKLALRPGSGVPVDTVRQRIATLRQVLEGVATK